MVNVRELKARIVKKGLTQSELAKRMYISENSLSSKMNGKSRFYIDEAVEICKILGIKDDKEKADIFLS